MKTYKCQTAPRRSQRRSGFTLIELLTVIAIIGILAAMLFPTFSRAREMARRTSCASNMKQLGYAFAQYTGDNDGRFPGAAQFQRWGNGGHWVAGTNDAPLADPVSQVWVAGATAQIEQGALYTYVKNNQIYICPSNEDGRKKLLSYSMNCALAGLNDAAIQGTSDVIVLVDEEKANDGYFWASDNSNSTDALTQVHNDGGNLLFSDSHVKFYPFRSFTLDNSATGRANKSRQTGTPRFHEPSFGPNGSNFIPGDPLDTCGGAVPVPTVAPTPTPTP